MAAFYGCLFCFLCACGVSDSKNNNSQTSLSFSSLTKRGCKSPASIRFDPDYALEHLLKFIGDIQETEIGLTQIYTNTR